MKKILLMAMMAVFVNTASAQGFFGKVVKGLDKATRALDKAIGTKSNSTNDSSDPESTVTMDTQSLGEAVLKIEKLHPDLKVRVTRSEVADKVAYIDLEFTSMAIEDVSAMVTSRWNADAIDDNGIEIGRTNVRFTAPNVNRTDFMDFDLVQGVKKKITVQIQGVSKVAEMLARLRFEVKFTGGMDVQQKFLTIRNIPLNREDAE